MELKYSIATTFLLCLLLVTHYNISRVGSDAADSEVYGIDYRGPETHSSVVPPPLVALVTGLGFIKILSRHLINPKVLEAMTEENKLMKSMDE